jgi:hypothetical protein
MKILKPSFFKDQKKRIKYRQKSIERSKEYQEMSGMEKRVFLDSLSELELSPVEIIHPKNNSVNLAWYLHATDLHSVGFLLFEAMNKKDKTVTIKIHLDRQEVEIIQDVKFLLNRIKRVGKLKVVDLSPLKHHQDAFNRCFKVHDLKQSGKKWREIAKIICGDNVSPDSAKGIVRSLYKKAEQMIKEGGRRI